MDVAEKTGASDAPELPSHIAAADDPSGQKTMPVADRDDENIVQDQGSGLGQEEIDRLTADIIAAIKTVYDPEIPVDIYELGLIYKIEINDNRHVDVDMTLTAPGCPVAGEMPLWVEGAVGMVEGVSGVSASMVFEPPWDISRMSDEARVALNMW